MGASEFAREAFAAVLEKPITLALERSNPKDPRIAMRKQPGSPYRVRLRAIGTWDHPERYRDLLTEQAVMRAAVETRVRAELVAAGRLAMLEKEDPDTATARLAVEVDRMVDADEPLKALAARNNLAILVEGLAGGEAEVQRIHTLGGPRLLSQVLDEIHAYHVLDFETGEG